MNTLMTTAAGEIEKMTEDFTAAWNAHDASLLAQVFASDADFTNVFGQQFQGRAAIQQQHAPIFATIFKNSHFCATKTSVRMLTGNLAAVDVFWTMNGATDRQGNPWNNRRGLMNLIVKEENETWVILIMHNMDVPVTPS